MTFDRRDRLGLKAWADLLFQLGAPQVVLLAVHVDRQRPRLSLPDGVGLCRDGADFFKLDDKSEAEAPDQPPGRTALLFRENSPISLPLLCVLIPNNPGGALSSPQLWRGV